MIISGKEIKKNLRKMTKCEICKEELTSEELSNYKKELIMQSDKYGKIINILRTCTSCHKKVYYGELVKEESSK